MGAHADIRAFLKEFVDSAGNKGTAKSYTRYQVAFREFCGLRRLSTEDPLALGAFYVHCLEVNRYASKTLGVVASAVAKLFHFESAKPHQDPLVKETLKAAQARAKQAVSKKPLSIRHLDAMAMCVKPHFESVRNFFMLLLMTAGMMRESEVVNLRADQVWVEEFEKGGSALFVFVWKSKTDTAERGHTVVLAEPENSRLNAVKWFHLYVRIREAARLDSAWLLYNATTGAKLASTTPNHIIKRLLPEVGVKDPENYGSHSCRRGGATAAAASGVEERLIKRHGNWRSDAVHLYIAESLANRLSVSSKMLDLRN